VTRAERNKTIVLWGITAALVAYVALTTDLERFLGALSGWAPVAILGLAFVDVLISWAYDTFSLRVLFQRLTAAVPFRDLLFIKGASYLLNVVNYNAGAIAIAYFVKEQRRVPFFETFGAILLLNAIDLVAMAVMMGAGYALVPQAVGEPGGAVVRVAVVLVGGGFVLNYLFWQVEPRLPLLHGLTRRGLFHAVRRARLADYGVLILLRLCMLCIYLTAYWIAFRLFDVAVPWTLALVYYPMLIFVGVLPISVAGFGSSQIASRFLFGAFAVVRAGGLFLPLAVAGAALLVPGGPASGLQGAHELLLNKVTAPDPVIDAFSTVTLTGFLVSRVLVGMFCLPEARKVTKFDAQDTGEAA
jgi:hypothetical protein